MTCTHEHEHIWWMVGIYLWLWDCGSYLLAMAARCLLEKTPPESVDHVASHKGQGDRVASNTPSKPSTKPRPSPSTADVDAQDTSGYKTASALALEVNIHACTHMRIRFSFGNAA